VGITPDVSALDSPPEGAMPTRAILRLPPGQIVSATSASNAATATILPTARPGPLLRRSHKVAARPRICAFRDVTIAMTILHRVLPVIALAVLWLVPAAPCTAQDYPSRTVKMIVPFGAGGPTDIFTRLLAEELRKSLKEPFVMENRPGAGTIIGTDAAAKSPPDGYTLLMISATQTTTETLVPNKPYKLLRDFVPVASLLNSELVMVVPASVPVNTVKEFIALAKSKPGALNYASSGVGSNYHMAGELFKNLTGTDILHVPYKGSSGARNDIISGQIEMMFDSLPSMAPIIQAGRVKALGTTGKARSAILPDVPTLSEAGVPGYEATIWIGLMVPTGTPQPIVTLLSTEINKILARPDVREAWEKQGATPMIMKPEEFGVYVQSEIDKWAKVIKANNIKPE
jgi:tripartite-type tricarboxylate transporter receptor subunit TctC